jgi:hypothetical protein
MSIGNQISYQNWELGRRLLLKGGNFLERLTRGMASAECFYHHLDGHGFKGSSKGLVLEEFGTIEPKGVQDEDSEISHFFSNVIHVRNTNHYGSVQACIDTLLLKNCNFEE